MGLSILSEQETQDLDEYLRNSLSSANESILKLANARLIEMGEYESGLWNYYVTKLRSNCLFDHYDISVADYISKNYNPDTKILEIAAGCGAVSFGLEKFGFTNIEFSEFDHRRGELCKYIKKSLNSNMALHLCDYRTINLQEYDVIWTINAVSSAIGVQDYELLRQTILSGSDVILRYAYYGDEGNARGIKIFEKLDSDPGISSEPIAVHYGNERGIIRYFAN